MKSLRVPDNVEPLITDAVEIMTYENVCHDSANSTEKHLYDTITLRVIRALAPAVDLVRIELENR